MSGHVKTFFRQQKAHTGGVASKPSGGISKKAVHHHHHQKQAGAQLLHPTPGVMALT